VAAARKSFSMDHPVVVTLLIFAIIGFMYLAAEVLKPLALAVLLAFALAPLCAFLERRGLPRFLAAVLTVVSALVAIGFVGYKLGGQLSALTSELPKLEKNLLPKLKRFQLAQGGSLTEVTRVAEDVSATIAPSREPEPERVLPVRVVNQGRATLFSLIAQTLGPILEAAGILAFDLILVLFILSNREDLTDRMIRLFGRGRISLTTRTMGEVGHRISKYLVMIATVNSCVGLVVGLGLWAIGLPYPLLWGVLAALLRFVPYAGPAMAFALPFLFSLAQGGEYLPWEVAGLFLTLEIVANSFVEPMIYGKTTGVSALGLLVAAMFWTWLWGALGLLLSTPMTVCLAVLGKYVPALRFFATILGEEAPLKPDVRFYQRLLALDHDGASELADEVLKDHPRAELFDTILIPTLSMVERDHARDEIEDRQRDFAWRAVDEIVLDLESVPPRDIDLPPPVPTLAEGEREPAALPGGEAGEPIRVVGIPANDRGDLLTLSMLQVLLEPSGCRMTLTDPGEPPLQLMDRLAADPPGLIVVSHLPPAGLTSTRYLVRRLRARFKDVPILVGRWSETSADNESAERLAQAGATQVFATLAEARDPILKRSGHSPTAEAGAEAPREAVGV
jgi:predicted PurR-regulated permease PerM